MNEFQADREQGGEITGMVLGSPGMSADSEEEGKDGACPSSPESSFEEGYDLEDASMCDDVTAQLAAAGPVGVAAAAAIMSSKKRKRLHSFETNPSIRKRQQNRLLRKLRQTIEEFATRVGQQAIVLVATPGKPNTSYKVFGAKPLEDVIRNLRGMIVEELDNALAHQAPPPIQDDPTLFELPPLIIDGIPTPVEKMTQAQLRAFIPLMLKYSTGRGKPGWGRESTRPVWWPVELPWANVRMDARTDDEKQKISWTHALRQIVINCYKFHGREDLLPAFTKEDVKANLTATTNANLGIGVVKMEHPNTLPAFKIEIQENGSPQIIAACPDSAAQASVENSGYSSDVEITTQYLPNVYHTITNPDGSLSILQVDPNNAVITLPDGTTAHVQGMAAIQSSQGDNKIHTIQTFSAEGGGSHGDVLDYNSITEAMLNSEGQVILTTEDGQVVTGSLIVIE